MTSRLDAVQVSAVCNVPLTAQCVPSTQLRCKRRSCVSVSDVRAETSSLGCSRLLGFPALYLAEDEASRCFRLGESARSLSGSAGRTHIHVL